MITEITATAEETELRKGTEKRKVKTWCKLNSILFHPSVSSAVPPPPYKAGKIHRNSRKFTKIHRNSRIFPEVLVNSNGC
jgi:hypothetical protein